MATLTLTTRDLLHAAEEMRERAAKLVQIQADVFEWQSTQQFRQESDSETAQMLRELAERIRRLPVEGE